MTAIEELCITAADTTRANCEEFIRSNIAKVANTVAMTMNTLNKIISVQADELCIYRIVAAHMKGGTFTQEIWLEAEAKLVALHERVKANSV